MLNTIVSFAVPIIASGAVSSLFWYRRGYRDGYRDSKAFALKTYSGLIKRAYAIGKERGRFETASGFRSSNQTTVRNNEE